MTFIAPVPAQVEPFELRRKTSTTPGIASLPGIAWLTDDDYIVSLKTETTLIRTAKPESLKQLVANSPALDGLLAQLWDSRRDPEEDDLAPTDLATTIAYRLLKNVSNYLPADGRLYRDGFGGLRIEWEVGDKELSIAMNAKGIKDNYLYWQVGKERALETPLDTEMLSKKLLWLQNKHL